MKALLIGIIILFYGCSYENTQLKTTPLVFNDTIIADVKILNDSFLFGSILNIDYYNDYLIVSSLANNKFIHLFNKHTGELYKSVLPQGRAQNEIATIGYPDVDKTNGNIIFYDFMSRTKCTINIDSVINNCEILNKKRANYNALKLINTKNNLIAVGESLQNNIKNRFVMINSDTVYQRYNSYPNVTIASMGNKSAEAIEAGYFYNSYQSISPNGENLVCVSGFGAIVEIFNITNKITPTHTKAYILPDFILDEYDAPIPAGSKTILGFSDVYATTNRIYTVFIGEESTTVINKIAVFNWEGNCEQLYKVKDYKIEQICVDEYNKRLYALVQNSESETMIVYFDL